MVLLLSVVSPLILWMVLLFITYSTAADLTVPLCVKRTCPNTTDKNITANSSTEHRNGDIFHDISKNPDIKSISEVHDTGHYTSLCWTEITTITETKNGSKSAVREYSITFETPSDIPDKYIKKNGSDYLGNETIQYTIFDKDTKKSEVVNFTTVSSTEDAVVRQNRKVLCGSGPIYTKQFLEWPLSNRKRIEIKVSPKKQGLIATDCIIVSPQHNIQRPSSSDPPVDTPYVSTAINTNNKTPDYTNKDLLFPPLKPDSNNLVSNEESVTATTVFEKRSTSFTTKSFSTRSTFDPSILNTVSHNRTTTESVDVSNIKKQPENGKTTEKLLTTAGYMTSTSPDIEFVDEKKEESTLSPNIVTINTSPKEDSFPLKDRSSENDSQVGISKITPVQSQSQSTTLGVSKASFEEMPKVSKNEKKIISYTRAPITDSKYKDDTYEILTTTPSSGMSTNANDFLNESTRANVENKINYTSATLLDTNVHTSTDLLYSTSIDNASKDYSKFPNKKSQFSDASQDTVKNLPTSESSTGVIGSRTTLHPSSMRSMTGHNFSTFKPELININETQPSEAENASSPIDQEIRFTVSRIVPKVSYAPDSDKSVTETLPDRDYPRLSTIQDSYNSRSPQSTSVTDSTTGTVILLKPGQKIEIIPLVSTEVTQNVTNTTSSPPSTKQNVNFPPNTTIQVHVNVADQKYPITTVPDSKKGTSLAPQPEISIRNSTDLNSRTYQTEIIAFSPSSSTVKDKLPYSKEASPVVLPSSISPERDDKNNISELEPTNTNITQNNTTIIRDLESLPTTATLLLSDRLTTPFPFSQRIIDDETLGQPTDLPLNDTEEMIIRGKSIEPPVEVENNTVAYGTTPRENIEMAAKQPSFTGSGSTSHTHTNIDLIKLCNSSGQKVVIKVKILMEHVIEENDGDKLYRHSLPIMGIEKKTEFDIDKDNIQLQVSEKKVNDDWIRLLDDLSINFFSFNRNAVSNYSDMLEKHLDLNTSKCEDENFVLGFKESYKRLQKIKDLNNQCLSNETDVSNQTERYQPSLRLEPSKPVIDSKPDVNTSDTKFYRYLIQKPQFKYNKENDTTVSGLRNLQQNPKIVPKKPNDLTQTNYSASVDNNPDESTSMYEVTSPTTDKPDGFKDIISALLYKLSILLEKVTSR